MEFAAALKNGLTELAAHPRRAMLALAALCLAVYLPGVIRLPPVDRTEAVYAETTRDMVERGNWLDPRYGETVHQFRPIGTYWAQGVAATLGGESRARDITVYRLPGLIAVTLAVMALYWLSVPLVGSTPALIAASLFAVAPLTVLLSQLAITEGLALLPAVVAMLALLRIYCAPPDAETRTLAALLWTAIGAAMLLNALQTPILIAAALAALYAFDRDLTWLRRTRPLLGVPLALLIASPWVYIRALQDGVPFSGMSVSDVLAALGGSQDMKLRAFPGTFILAALLGFLPGTALLAPALRKLWQRRDGRIARFLLAWVIGYIIYLELISSKPGTYTVQVMFPAFALAVAMLVATEDGKLPAPKFHALAPPILAALFAIVLLVAPYALMRQTPSGWIAPPILAVAALFFISARDGRAGQLTSWAATGTAALGLFAMTLLGGVLPSVEKIWPARQIERFAGGCDPGTTFGVLGFREPTARFVLQSGPAAQNPEALAKDAPDILFVESRRLAAYEAALTMSGAAPPARYGCIPATNVMRGCPLIFAVVGKSGTEADRCFKLPPASCDVAAAAGLATKACD